VALLAIEDVANGSAARADRQQVATLLGLPQDEVPPVHRTGWHMSRGPQGELLGHCPQVPSALEAKRGSHVDPKNPSKKASVCGYLHLKTTELNRELGLALPLGNSTSPADVHAGTAFSAPRTALAMPVVPGHVHLGDAA
jgi:hypothetical protein